MKILISILVYLCFFCNVAFASQSFDTVFNMTFNDFKKGMYEKYSPISEEKKMSYKEFKDAVQEKWGIFKATRGAEWVQYDEQYVTRSTVNFVRGTIEMSVLVEDNSARAKKEAYERLCQHFYATHMNCLRHLGFGLLYGLEGDFDVTVMPNLPKEAFPQLYPIEKPKEEPEVQEKPDVEEAPKPAVPKSYVEEMRMREENPSAFSGTEGKDSSALQSYN